MSFTVYALHIVLGVILCLKTSCIKGSYITVKNNGPTTLGGSTEFFVELFGCGQGQFRYCYLYIGSNCYESGHHFNFTISNWKSSGKQTVTVVVEQDKPKYLYCGKKKVSVYIADTILAELKTVPRENFKVGPVLFSVQTHDPSHMFSSITYYWDFGDGSYLNDTKLANVRHNFTENRTYKARVRIFAYSRGKFYNRTLKSNDMTFGVDLDPKLLIISRNGSSLMLPSDKTDASYVAQGHELVFIVAYNNPYSIVKSIFTQWYFEGSQQYSLHGNSIEHTFKTNGQVSLWITSTFITKQGNANISLPLQKNIIVEEPITGLKFDNKSFIIPSKYITVNISCNGRGPFKMCWELYQSSIHGDPFMANCTSALSPNCQFDFNQTLSQQGLFILRITVLNRVGSAYLVKHFTIPKPVPTHHSKGTKAVSAIVPIVACIFVFIALLFVARKIYTIRHRSVLETADFDFRDEDCRSVDSMSMGRWCPSFRLCKKISKNKESYPLLEEWNTKDLASHYSTIL